MGLQILGLCLSVHLNVYAAVTAPIEALPASALPSSAAAPPTSEPALTYPSLTHYPALTASLREALAQSDSSGVLRGLADTFAAARSPDLRAWERLAYIRIGEPVGFVVNRDDKPTPLAAGRHDLGCSGAMLEALRLLWLPRVELDELGACDPEGAVDCEDDAHFGHSLLRHISHKLDPQWLAAGAELRQLPLKTRAIDLGLQRSDQLQLCTVSHRARKMKGRRYFHHMVVLDPARDKQGRVHLFDTTGRRGVAYRPLRTSQLARYLRTTLATGNKTFAYTPGSAQLHCLGVTRPEQVPDALAAANQASIING